MSNAVISAAPEQRHAEEQLQGDDRAQHLGQVAGGDRDLGQQPEYQVDAGEYSARQACARSCPVTTPSRAASVCSSTAIRFDISRTQISA